MIYKMPKNAGYSNSSTDWHKLSLIFTEENYGIKLLYDKIYSVHADCALVILQ